MMLLLLLSFSMSNIAQVTQAKQTGSKIINIRAQNFNAALQQNKNAQLLDIRTQGEYQRGHLKNAILVNFYDPNFSKNIEKLYLDKSKPVFIYCRSGSRSGHAIKVFKKLRFKVVYNLVYGINEWYAQKLPLEN